MRNSFEKAKSKAFSEDRKERNESKEKNKGVETKLSKFIKEDK